MLLAVCRSAICTRRCSRPWLTAQPRSAVTAGAFPFRLRRQLYPMQKMIGRIVKAEYKQPAHVRPCGGAAHLCPALSDMAPGSGRQAFCVSAPGHHLF